MREFASPARAVAGGGRCSAIATESREAGRAAAEVLAAGGNAVDAAVALGFCASVTLPSATTIAGSGFMLVDGDAGTASIEFPPRAPLAARADMYRLSAGGGGSAMMGVAAVADGANDVGAKAAGVPGVVAGLCAAHARFGRLPLAAVLAPAVALAQDGFETTPELQLATLAALPHVRADPELAETFLDAQGAPPIGDFGFSQSGAAPVLVRQPRLARALRAIAQRGHDGFYAGDDSDRLVAAVRARGGLLDTADLARYRADLVAPLTVAVGAHRIAMPAAPCGAWTVAQLLKAWEAATAMGDGVRDLHRRAELARHAFADRYHWHADPDHVAVPLAALLGDGHAARLAAAVDDRRATFGLDRAGEEPWIRFAAEQPHALPAAAHAHARPAPVGVPSGLGDSRETTHYSVVDGDGLLVSCTMTAANGFGARVMCEGILLDDAMIWFNASPGYANSIAPWKRPLVNMAPIVVTRADGARLALGAPGGRRIVMAVAEVARRWLCGESLEAALDAPRTDASGRELLASPRLGDELLDGLRERGHPLRIVDDRDRFSYEFAHPVAVACDRRGERSAGVQPYCGGYVAVS